MDDHNNLAFIASIIQQACSDACSLDANAQQQNARDFLQLENKLFCSYCLWLDIEPVWAVPYLHERVIKHEQFLLTKVLLDRTALFLGLLLYPRKLYRHMMRRNKARWRNFAKFLEILGRMPAKSKRFCWELATIVLAKEGF